MSLDVVVAALHDDGGSNGAILTATATDNNNGTSITLYYTVLHCGKTVDLRLFDSYACKRTLIAVLFAYRTENSTEWWQCVCLPKFTKIKMQCHFRPGSWESNSKIEFFQFFLFRFDDGTHLAAGQSPTPNHAMRYDWWWINDPGWCGTAYRAESNKCMQIDVIDSLCSVRTWCSVLSYRCWWRYAVATPLDPVKYGSLWFLSFRRMLSIESKTAIYVRMSASITTSPLPANPMQARHTHSSPAQPLQSPNRDRHIVNANKTILSIMIIRFE